jgi:hypothetical protein
MGVEAHLGGQLTSTRTDASVKATLREKEVVVCSERTKFVSDLPLVTP